MTTTTNQLVNNILNKGDLVMKTDKKIKDTKDQPTPSATTDSVTETKNKKKSKKKNQNELSLKMIVTN